jgi:hypothetical protein
LLDLRWDGIDWLKVIKKDIEWEKHS